VLEDRLDRVTRCGRLQAEGEQARALPCEDEVLCPHCARHAAARIAHHATDTWGTVTAVRLTGPPGDLDALRRLRTSEYERVESGHEPRWVEGYDHVWFFFLEGDRASAERRFEGQLVRLVGRQVGEELLRTWLSVHEAATALADDKDSLATFGWLQSARPQRTGGGPEACRLLSWPEDSRSASAVPVSSAQRPEPTARRERRLPDPAPRPPVLEAVDLGYESAEEALSRLGTALTIVETMSDERPENMTWQRDVLRNHVQISQALRALDRPQDALAQCQKATDRAEKVRVYDPTHFEFQRTLTRLFAELGFVLTTLGQRRNAAAALRECLAESERLSRLAPNPDDPELQQELFDSRRRLGDTLLRLGDADGALRACAHVIDAAERLARSRGEQVEAQRDLALSYELAGDAYRARGDHPSALEAYRESFSGYEVIMGLDRDDPQLQRDLHRIRTRIGRALAQIGELPEAAVAHRRALSVAAKQSALHANDLDWQRSVAESHAQLGETLRAQGDLKGAYEALRAAMMAQESVCRAATADEIPDERELLVIRIAVGDVLLDQGDVAGAHATFRGALPMAEKLVELDPDHPYHRRDLCICHERIGDTGLRQGAVSGALKAYEEAAAIAGGLATAGPRESAYPLQRRDVADSVERLGDALLASDDERGAEQAYLQALAARMELAERDPDDADAQRQLFLTQLDLGGVHERDGRLPAAYELYESACAVAKDLAALNFTDSRRRQDLAIAHERAGDTLLAQADLPHALEAYQTCLRLRRVLVNEAGTDGLRLRDLSVTHERLGDVSLARGDTQEALAQYRASLALRELMLKLESAEEGWTFDQAIARWKIGEALAAEREIDGALEACFQAHDQLERLTRVEPDRMAWREAHANCRRRIDDLVKLREQLAGSPIRALERRVRKNARRFEVMALVTQLGHMGYEFEDIIFRSHLSMISQSSLVYDVEFVGHPVQQAVVTLNLGLLTPDSPLPSYYHRFLETQNIDEDAFVSFLRFFDHGVLQAYLRAVYPERDATLFPDWERTKHQQLQLLAPRSQATLYWIFQQAFPELGLELRRSKLGRKLNVNSSRLGRCTLGGNTSLGGRTAIAVTGYDVLLYTDEEYTATDVAWGEEAKHRLEEIVFPAICETDLVLSVQLIIRTQRGWAQLKHGSYLGFDRVRGDVSTARVVVIHQGEVPNADLLRLRAQARSSMGMRLGGGADRDADLPVIITD
jgi:tetratricopeptide (TPR) repeat protein